VTDFNGRDEGQRDWENAMLVGEPSVFAIESGITIAYECLSLRALGFFVVHVGGRSYGRRSPDSTMLACSFDEVERRIADRGKHTAPFAAECETGRIAYAFRNAMYAEVQDESHFGIPLSEFHDLAISHHLDDWTAHGDEAFDDGSYLLQFDVEDRVRLIAYSSKGFGYDPASLSDMWLAADDFYRILQQWHEAFAAEWAGFPKASEL
jgi:hypothetical protein